MTPTRSMREVIVVTSTSSLVEACVKLSVAKILCKGWMRSRSQRRCSRGALCER